MGTWIFEGRKVVDISPNTWAALREELVGLHRCHTVILYGSRARGDAHAESDWDVAGIRESGTLFRIARPWQGTFLDAFVYAEAELATPSEELLKLRGGALLHDEKKFGQAFLTKLEAFYDAGPLPRAMWEWEMQRVWFLKTLARIRRQDVEARLRQGWLIMDALEYVFRFQGRFYPGPKQALAWLGTHDVAMLRRFEAALAPSADVSNIEELVDAVVQLAPHE